MVNSTWQVANGVTGRQDQSSGGSNDNTRTTRRRGRVIDWAFSYLDDEHRRYSAELLAMADALLLGRKTYEGLSTAYRQMEATAAGDFLDFVRRMNGLPKHVVTKSLVEFEWNASRLDGDVVEAIRTLKGQPGGDILKSAPARSMHCCSSTGSSTVPLLADPGGRTREGAPLFQDVAGAPALTLIGATPFRSGVVALRYAPGPS